MERDAREAEDFFRCVTFHGHTCPGLVIGYRAALEALERLSGERSQDEELVAVVENNACGVDAVQVLTGCTFGKGNLVYRDHGKHVFTFYERGKNRGVRVALRAGALTLSDEHRALARKVRMREATKEEQERFQALHREKAGELLRMPLQDLFDVREVQTQAPPKAQIEPSEACEGCGEPTMVSRLEAVQGRRLCRECAKKGQGFQGPSGSLPRGQR